MMCSRDRGSTPPPTIQEHDRWICVLQIGTVLSHLLLTCGVTSSRSLHHSFSLSSLLRLFKQETRNFLFQYVHPAFITLVHPQATGIQIKKSKNNWLPISRESGFQFLNQLEIGFLLL